MLPSPRRRVGITGVGVVSPVGVGAERFWSAIRDGRSGLASIKAFDASHLPCRIAGEVRDFEPADHLSRRDVVRTDRFVHFALAAAYEAAAQARLDVAARPERVGVSIGTGMGGLPTYITAWNTLQTSGAARVDPYTLPGSLPNMAAGWVSMRLRASGPISAPSTACAAGAQAIGEAYRFIQADLADAMIAGGADALIHPLVVACFAALGALSLRNDDPERASRPFDATRDGFVLSEGAGVVILEELEAARRRGVPVLAEVLGFGLSSDAHHPTASSQDGAARAMAQVLTEAHLAPEAIDYINAHGTSTLHNDRTETEAIKRVFGSHAYRLGISSIKSMTGHLLGAAGAVEAIATALALRDQVMPPTTNLITADPQCDLDYVPHTSRRAPIRVAMSNSFAFGGANAILLLGQASEG